MSKKTTNSRPKPEPKESRMYPELHPLITSAVADTVGRTYFKRDENAQHRKEWSTFIMGRFTCTNQKCRMKWSSKIVTILIRGYPGNGYNATVFTQRCESCENLGRLTVDEDSYVERVVHRLKVWANVPVERPQYGSKRGPPHKSALCEGCKRGICRRSDF